MLLKRINQHEDKRAAYKRKGGYYETFIAQALVIENTTMWIVLKKKKETNDYTNKQALKRSAKKQQQLKKDMKKNLKTILT